MERNAKIYVAGHQGLAGSAIVRRLQKEGYTNLVMQTHTELDLTDPVATSAFFQQEKPQYVFLTAAKVGGIQANYIYSGEFIYQNLLIQTHVIHQSYLHGVKKLLFLGSSCIYPKHCPQPMKEEHLLSGYLETSNEAYAISKITGIKMLQSYNRQYGTNFIAVMPPNLFGPFDNFDLESSHVLPAFIRKFHDAKVQGNAPVHLWGTGTPQREFLYSDDMADGSVFVMQQINAGDTGDDFYNLAAGKEITLLNLAHKIQEIVGHQGKIFWDSTKSDGTPRKIMDPSRLENLGWRAKTDFGEALSQSYQWFRKYGCVK